MCDLKYKETLLAVAITLSLIIFILQIFNSANANSKNNSYPENDNSISIIKHPNGIFSTYVYNKTDFFSIEMLSHNIMITSTINYDDNLLVQHEKLRPNTYLRTPDMTFKKDDDISIKQARFFVINLGKGESDKNTTIFTNSADQYNNKIIRVLIEFKVSELNNSSLTESILKLVSSGFMHDTTFKPILMEREYDVQIMVIRGSVMESKVKQLESLPFVIRVWQIKENAIRPFD